jgi:hypothetical protein
MTTINLETFCAYDDFNNLDFNKTMNKFQDVLSKYQSEEKSNDETIKVAVNYVFDNEGSPLKMPYLQQAVLPHLNAQKVNYEILKEKIRLFIKKSSDFNIVKGHGGGVIRLSDKK